MARSGTSFQPGQSGNPGGRPKAAIAMRDKIRERGDDLADFLFDAMDNEDVPWAQRVNAARTLYEFGYGKAPASVKIENKEPTFAQGMISLLKRLDEEDEARKAKKEKEAKKNEPADPSPSGNPDSADTENTGTVH